MYNFEEVSIPFCFFTGALFDYFFFPRYFFFFYFTYHNPLYCRLLWSVFVFLHKVFIFFINVTNLSMHSFLFERLISYGITKIVSHPFTHTCQNDLRAKINVVHAILLINSFKSKSKYELKICCFNLHRITRGLSKGICKNYSLFI